MSPTVTPCSNIPRCLRPELLPNRVAEGVPSCKDPLESDRTAIALNAQGTNEGTCEGDVPSARDVNHACDGTLTQRLQTRTTACAQTYKQDVAATDAQGPFARMQAVPS